MAAGDQLGVLVAAVVDQRFVQAAEAGAGIGADVFDAQRFDDVDHEVGAGPIGGEDFENRRSLGIGRLRQRNRGGGGGRRLRLGGKGSDGGGSRGDGSGRSALEETAAGD